MNKPLHPTPVADDDIGPLDEHGQQIWSPEEEEAIARLDADPDFRASIERAEADIDAGRFYTHEQVVARSKEMKRKWFAGKGITPPPGYFDH